MPPIQNKYVLREIHDKESWKFGIYIELLVFHFRYILCFHVSRLKNCVEFRYINFFWGGGNKELCLQFRTNMSSGNTPKCEFVIFQKLYVLLSTPISFRGQSIACFYFGNWRVLRKESFLVSFSRTCSIRVLQFILEDGLLWPVWSWGSKLVLKQSVALWNHWNGPRWTSKWLCGK